MDGNATQRPTTPAKYDRRQTDYGTLSIQHGEASTNCFETQDGVRVIEAVSMTWTKWGLIFAYFSVFLMAFSTSLEGQVTFSLQAFAVSSFNTHSLISTVYVVQGVVNAVIKSPMAKIADVFGRFEAFSMSIVLYVLGYIQMACSQNVETYASAQIFYSAGSTGLQILQQVFIADTSDLLNRALFSSLPDTPFLVTVWIGPVIGSAILSVASWRWGYGMWAIILPVAFIPLALSLFINGRKARKLGLVAKRPKARSFSRSARKLFVDLDVVGILLLSSACALILIPLTLAPRVENGWRNSSIISMIVLGFVFLVAFPIFESRPKLAPHPLIPLNLLKSRTFCAGCGIGFFYFMVFYLSVQPYFYSYLLVVHNKSVATAGHIMQIFSFSSTVAAVIVSLVIKYTRRYKPFVVGGSLVYLAGIGMMMRTRTQDASVARLVGVQMAVGAGCGVLNVPAQLGVQASTRSHQQVAAATAVFLTLVEIGGAVGSAMSGALWSRLVPAKLALYLPPEAGPRADDIYASVVAALAYDVGSPERVAINRAYQETMTALLAVAAAACVPVVLLSLLMEDLRLDGVRQGVRGRVIGGEVVIGGGSGEQLVSAPRGRRGRWDPRGWSFRRSDSEERLV